jgi:hypothetical protein
VRILSPIFRGTGSACSEAQAVQEEVGMSFERMFRLIVYGSLLLLVVGIVTAFLGFYHECPNGITGQPGCMWP